METTVAKTDGLWCNYVIRKKQDSMNEAMLKGMLNMVPEPMRTILGALSETMPDLCERVIAGELEPTDAATMLGQLMVPAFTQMKEGL